MCCLVTCRSVPKRSLKVRASSLDWAQKLLASEVQGMNFEWRAKHLRVKYRSPIIISSWITHLLNVETNIYYLPTSFCWWMLALLQFRFGFLKKQLYGIVNKNILKHVSLWKSNINLHYFPALGREDVKVQLLFWYLPALLAFLPCAYQKITAVSMFFLKQIKFSLAQIILLKDEHS